MLKSFEDFLNVSTLFAHVVGVWEHDRNKNHGHGSGLSNKLYYCLLGLKLTVVLCGIAIFCKTPLPPESV